MQVQPVMYCQTEHNISPKDSKASIVVPKRIIRNAAMLATAMLSLGVMGQSDLGLNNINNKVEQATCSIAKNRYAVVNQPVRHNKTDKIPMSDEEKIHKLAIAFTLLGFFAPIVMNIFTNNCNKKYIEDFEE